MSTIKLIFTLWLFGVAAFSIIVCIHCILCYTIKGYGRSDVKSMNQ